MLRIVGPNCIGVLSPANKLNASFAHGTGLGLRLMQEIIAYAKSIDLKQMFGDVLASPEPGVIEVTLDL